MGFWAVFFLDPVLEPQGLAYWGTGFFSSWSSQRLDHWNSGTLNLKP